MVEISVGRNVELECSEADIVEGFVVDAESFVRVFDQLVDGQRGVVRLDDGVGDLCAKARDEDGEGERGRRIGPWETERRRR